MDKLTSQLENFFGGDSDTSADFTDSSSVSSEQQKSKSQSKIEEHLDIITQNKVPTKQANQLWRKKKKFLLQSGEM
jgi:hypothetical protein